MDLEAEHTRPDAKTLEYIHRSKTAALITASVVSGCIYAGASEAQVDKLREFGRAVGVAFQIADDVLDVTQSSEQLGKTAGKDVASEKATYPALFGIEESLQKADKLVDTGCDALDSFGARAETLKALARFHGGTKEIVAPNCPRLTPSSCIPRDGVKRFGDLSAPRPAYRHLAYDPTSPPSSPSPPIVTTSSRPAAARCSRWRSAATRLASSI